jgi:uncharacterized protein
VDDFLRLAAMSLRELRRALGLPQREVARRLQKGQEEISRIENRSDLRLSTLHSYVGSLGGTLELVCSFKDRAPVRLRTGVFQAALATNPNARRLPRLPARITRHAAMIVALCKRHGVRRLAVFGSVLRPDFDPTSIVDFAVEFAVSVERSAAHRYVDFKAELEPLLGYAVNLVELRAMPDGTLKRIIEKTQIPLYAEAA